MTAGFKFDLKQRDRSLEKEARKEQKQKGKQSQGCSGVARASRLAAPFSN